MPTEFIQYFRNFLVFELLFCENFHVNDNGEFLYLDELIFFCFFVLTLLLGSTHDEGISLLSQSVHVILLYAVLHVSVFQQLSSIKLPALY